MLAVSSDQALAKSVLTFTLSHVHWNSDGGNARLCSNKFNNSSW